MNENKIGRERWMWIGAVTVLSSSLAWLALINLTLVVAAQNNRLDQVLIVVRAFTRVALALLGTAWPVFLAGLLGAALMVLVARGRSSASLDRGVRHV